MAQNFEKSVKGATKIKLAPPKSKYIDHILLATHSGEAGVAEIFRTLQLRLRDSTWTIVFKALIVLHLMVRDGAQDATLEYISENPRRIAVQSFSDVQSQGHNIKRYSEYFLARARAYKEAKVDFVRSGQGRLKRLSVDKGLLRETECVQRQIKALLRCNLLTDDVENEITLTAFRLLTLDLLSLYSVMNEGTINILEHYFEMSRPDSERALKIYKTFSAQTEEVVKFLGVARHFESATRLEIPNLKHASTDLARLLEDDLNDPDFDIRRKEFQVQKDAKRSGKTTTSTVSKNTANKSKTTNDNASSQPTAPAAAPPRNAPAPDLIDFFDSIEQNQQPMAPQAGPQQPQFQQANAFQQAVFQPQPPFQPGFQQTGFQQPVPQQTGFQQGTFNGTLGASATNPFAPTQHQQPLQSVPTGMGFGGYTPQSQSYGMQNTLPPIPQDTVATFPPQPQPMATGSPQAASNPFRQSTLVNPPATQNMGGNFVPAPLTRQNTNPFAKRTSPNPPQFSQPTNPPAPFQQNQTAQALQPQRTGTNPFARSSPAPSQQNAQTGLQPLQPNPTGSTNPFRQSVFVNQQTGQGWHVSGQHGTMGGLEQLETVPVFPRPGMG